MTSEPHSNSPGTTHQLTVDDLRSRTVISVESAGHVLGISRSTAYQAARTGELPTLRLGRKLVVPTARLLRMLGADTDREAV